MGDSKLLTKFHRLCDDYKAEFAIEGVVEGFDTLYPVPPERLTRGMTINTGEETRFVDFHSRKRPPVDIGDKVLVVGRNYSSKKNDVIPVAILSPTKKWVLFSRENPPKRPDKLELAITLTGGGILIAVWLLARDSYPLLVFGCFVIFFIFCPPPYILTYLRRPRLYSCNESEFQLLAEEIASKFGSKLTGLEQKLASSSEEQP